jgi:hypothetical protein
MRKVASQASLSQARSTTARCAASELVGKSTQSGTGRFSGGQPLVIVGGDRLTRAINQQNDPHFPAFVSEAMSAVAGLAEERHYEALTRRSR